MRPRGTVGPKMYAARMRRNISGHTSIRMAAFGAAALALIVGFADPWRLRAQAPEPAKGVKYVQIGQSDLKEWLTYLASDELQGRQVFTEGYGLAASYVADHLKQWGVKPIGDDATYFQTVRLKGYKVTRNSTVTVTVNGESKTFKHGDHVTFVPNSGGNQTVTFSGVEFMGYGSVADYQGRVVKDKLVVWLPNRAASPNTTPAGVRGVGTRRGRQCHCPQYGGRESRHQLLADAGIGRPGRRNALASPGCARTGAGSRGASAAAGARPRARGGGPWRQGRAWSQRPRRRSDARLHHG